MQLTTILLVIVAILMILSGLLILIGGIKQERPRFVWFFVAMVGGAIWTIMNGLQLWSTPGDQVTASWNSYGICIGSLVAGLGLLGYYLPEKKKVFKYTIMVVSSALAVGLMLVPLVQFDLLAAVTNGQNNWFYIAYSVLLTLIFLLTAAMAICRIVQMKDKKDRHGSIILFVGVLATLSISIIFNMVCPFVLHTNDFLWIGPLSIYILVLSFYLNLFSTHRITLNSRWFKILSYVIIITSCAVVYMILFFIIFTSLFRVPSPSMSVIMLNLIMLAVVLLLTPVISELSALVRSLISIDTIDVGYVARKLSRLKRRDVDLHELADFLASHLHFDYIGFVVDKKLYESEASQFDTDTLSAITKLKPAQHSVWQDMDGAPGKLLKKQKIVAVAELCDDKGKVFGQILIGKPLRKRSFERKDLIQIEAVVNLIATTIAPVKRKRK